MISAKVVADSVGPHGIRLLTIQARYHRYVHSELMTHRMFSRNAASSRAIPVTKMLWQVLKDPAMPVYWGKNQSGMQAREELGLFKTTLCKLLWVFAGYVMVCFAWLFTKIGLHKQIANRVLEPWMWMETIITATEWGNFFNLRHHEDAQPEFFVLAEKILKAINDSVPKKLKAGEWHLPYVTDEEVKQLPLEVLLKASTARCARVSFKNHDGTTPVVTKDIELHERLSSAPHASPFEHQARALAVPLMDANFRGWHQYRKDIPNENRPQYKYLKEIA